jgi:1,4-alpha-glucan branching enzyme
MAAGTHDGLHRRLGAHVVEVSGRPGTAFSVWAPNAKRVSLIGDFNGWSGEHHALTPLPGSGIWSGWVPGVGPGARYKYRVEGRGRGQVGDKSDPFAFATQTPPETASVVAELSYAWNDAAWIASRGQRSGPSAPISIYELHLGSWKRPATDLARLPTYRELAAELPGYLRRMGFTHVELLPVTEHPYYASWGYQTTGYFAPTARYGPPRDLMFLIDELHRAGIGVILDWVPSHFPTDGHGLGFFDGTHLFEHADPRQGFHPDWSSFIFNYDRGPVSSFLLSSAAFWIERYHVDALRVDAVASMLYLDYSRKDGEWIPNRHGGRENLAAIEFLRRLNERLHARWPDVRTIAEESTTWPMVSRPVYLGGLGFDMKWDMGWMHDTLDYMQLDPVHRKFNHSKLTFRMLYAFSENFVLPLSHDEVVHGKGSLLGKLPGDAWQRMASLRALFGLMYGQPGKKLLFMGSEIGPWTEWSHERGLEWTLLDFPAHAGLQRWVADLNHLYRELPALHELDFDGRGFQWIDCSDADQSVVVFSRGGQRPDAAPVIVACNFTPLPRHNYRVGVPAAGLWRERLNSDAPDYGGSGLGNLGSVRTVPMRYHEREHSMLLTLPPLSALFFQHAEPEPMIQL